MGVEERLGRRLGGVDGDVHRGPDGAGAVADRYGDGADARGELLVGEGPAARADLGELLVEGLTLLADVAGEPAPGRDRQDPVQLAG